MLKNFHSTLLYANNLKKTIQFYRKLGFRVERKHDSAHIRLKNFTLAFIDEHKTPITKEAGAKPKGLGVFTYIQVENVDKYFRALKKKGVRTSSAPRDWPWGKREFAVKDPDGYKLIFYTPIRMK